MNNKLKGYCLKLCKAIKEEEVTEILSQIEKECNVEWKPYGNTKGNYSSFENQQTTAEGALMEKIINSIDHKMIRQCKVKNIDPTSKDAPKTMEEAKNQLFTEEELKNEFINIIVDGEKDEMNVIIHDDGEGQSPENFESTFLSLQTGNKNNIPFVQGKFNMGSTGAVVFCGNNKYQLIVSRRSKVITGKQEKIGYTIVRKHKRTIEEQEKLKNTWYEYLTIDGLIPSFELDKIVLCKDFNSRYTFVNGTVVKLYNYQLNSKTQAFQTLKSTINSLIYEPAFPINVHESRRCFKIVKERKGITNIAWGNRKELEDDYFEQEKIEYISENNICKGENFGEAKIDIYVYKSNVGTDYLNDRRSKKPIVFLMNGQVQYHKSVSYITSELGFKLIKNHLFVVIDCTNLSKDFHDQGFFMANRESIRDTPDNREFINTITKYLKDEPKLKQLNRERAAQQVSSSGTQELFEKLLGKKKQDDFLKDMFKISDYGVKDKEDKDKEKAEDKENKNVSLNEFPTYVKMKGESSNNSKNIEVQQGKGFTLNFEIDAEDNFFKRVDDNGTLKINIASTGGKKGNGEGRKKYNIGNNGEKNGSI